MYTCNECKKVYKHSRSFKRHFQEKHNPIEYWICIEDNCNAKFIRRSYLSRHLILKHKYSDINARLSALEATRHKPNVDNNNNKYYDSISEDDSCFDLLEEISALKEQPMSKQQQESVNSFNMELLKPIYIKSSDYSDISDS